MALEIPYISIPTLDCMAYPFSAFPGLILPLIDAKKACFFSAFYRGNSLLSDYSDLPPDLIIDKLEEIRVSENEPVILTGPGAELFLSRLNKPIKHSFVSPLFNRAKAWELLHISKSIIIKEETDVDLGPLYLRKSDAELSKSQY